MENQNFQIKNFNDFNIPDLDNIDINTNSMIFYNSIYNDLIILTVNGNILYQGSYSSQSNSFSFNKYNLPSNDNNNNKIIQIDFTSNYIYFISQNKNEIYYTNYDTFINSLNNNFNFSLLQGIIQRKGI